MNVVFRAQETRVPSLASSRGGIEICQLILCFAPQLVTVSHFPSCREKRKENYDFKKKSRGYILLCAFLSFSFLVVEREPPNFRTI